MRFHVRNQTTGLLVLRNATRAQADAYLTQHENDDLAVMPAKKG